MGRIFLTNDFDVSTNTPDGMQINIADDAQPQLECPPRWAAGDAFPDEENWWSAQTTFVERFVEPNQQRFPDSHPARLLHNLRERLATFERETPSMEYEPNGTLRADVPEVVQQTETPPFLAGNQTPAPVQSPYIISEAELAQVQLDVFNKFTVDMDDYELEWDPEEDDDDEASSADETPPPSTPVRSQSLQLPRVISSPSVSIPPSQRRPTASVPATPVAFAGFGPPSRSLTTLPSITGTPISARSVARIRGFTVHSPRTELVL